MTKFFSLIVACCLISGTIIALDSCKKRVKIDDIDATSATADSTKEENTVLEVIPDSIVVNNNMGTFIISVDIPKDVNSPVGKAICYSIKGRMIEIDRNFRFDGNVTQVKAMMSAFIDTRQFSVKKDLGLLGVSIDSPFEMPIESIVRIKKIDEDAKWVSYESNEKLSGLAAPSAYVYVETFIKESGYKITWADFDTSAAGLHQLLINALKRNYGVSTDAELLQHVTAESIKSIKDIPFPGKYPCFTKNGIKLIYEACQIGHLAAYDGPEIIIPYKEILPYMTSKTKALVR